MSAGPQVGVSDVELEKGFLKGRFPADLQTADTARAPHELHLRLRTEGERLRGNLTAISRIRPTPDEESLLLLHFPSLVTPD